MVPVVLILLVWLADCVTAETIRSAAFTHREAQQVGAPSLAPVARTFNYRSCANNGQRGFANVEFVYDVETDTAGRPTLELTQSISRAMLERFSETICGLTFYQPVIRIESLSTGLEDEFVQRCNMTRSSSKSCSRYVGSFLVGLNNTSVLVSIDRRVSKLISPLLAENMASGIFMEAVNAEVASEQITRIAYVGVPIFGSKETLAANTDSQELTAVGYGLLSLCGVMVLSACVCGFYMYRSIVMSSPKEDVGRTFLMDEEEYDEEDRVARGERLNGSRSYLRSKTKSDRSRSHSPRKSRSSSPRKAGRSMSPHKSSRNASRSESPRKASRSRAAAFAEQYRLQTLQAAPLHVEQPNEVSVAHRLTKPKNYQPLQDDRRRSRYAPSPVRHEISL